MGSESGVPRQDEISQFHGSTEERNQEAFREGSVLQLRSSQDEWQADRLGVAEWAGAKGLCQGSGRNQEVLYEIPRRQERGVFRLLCSGARLPAFKS